MTGTELVFLNNSRETFTEDRSGAIATCLWELARAAASRGLSPHLISRVGPGVPYDWPRITWLAAARPASTTRRLAQRVRRRLDGWARPSQRAYAVRSLRVLRGLKPATIVVNNDPEIAVFLRRNLPGSRILHWFHNLETCSDRFRRSLMRDPGLRLAAVSAYLSRAVENVDELTPFRVATARNGVDRTRFEAARESRHGPVPVIGFLGRVAVEKGVDTLLEACLILAGRNERFAVQLAGDTNWGYSRDTAYRRRVDGLVSSLTAAGVEVRRTGHVARRDVPATLAATDIHVIPSRWDEPLGLTVLEGMAAGCAVVATAVGGIPEIVSDDGRLVERESPQALARALAPLVQDRSLVAALGERAHARAGMFTWQTTLDGLLSAGGMAP